MFEVSSITRGFYISVDNKGSNKVENTFLDVNNLLAFIHQSSYWKDHPLTMDSLAEAFAFHREYISVSFDKGQVVQEIKVSII